MPEHRTKIGRPVKVLIVDDSSVIRQLLQEIFASDPAIEVVGEAGDPLEAREKIKQLHPDVLTLDIEMPKMDGLAFLEKIMALRPMPVVMLSSLTKKGTMATLKALETGAFEAIAKPEHFAHDEVMQLAERLITTVKVAGQANVAFRRASAAPVSPASKALKPFAAVQMPEVIAIGASTGGVEAIRNILQGLTTADLPPMVMTQHMPAGFLEAFAKRLNMLSPLTVRVAEQGMALERGTLTIASGEGHLAVKKSPSKGLCCRVIAGEKVSGHLPSVDVMFDALAGVLGSKVMGILLTGMGSDGAKGLLKIKQQGGYAVAQDEASSVVYGMPAQAVALKAASVVLPLSEVAQRILSVGRVKTAPKA